LLTEGEKYLFTCFSLMTLAEQGQCCNYLKRRGQFVATWVCPWGWTWPPRVNFWSLAKMFTPSYTPRGEHSTEGRTEGLHPFGLTSP
jgi:hypothetical protein